MKILNLHVEGFRSLKGEYHTRTGTRCLKLHELIWAQPENETAMRRLGYD
jgi:hypothetical protein